MSETKEKKAYHHGDLRRTLVAEATRLVRDGGSGALTTRACAKAVGVAPSAVFRHFKDRRTLATATAVEGYKKLGKQIEDRMARADENAKMRAIGEAYLDFAMTEPNIFRLMFQGDLIDMHDPALLDASEPLLARTAARTSERTPSATDDAVLAWAVVHGLASLSIESQLDRHLAADPARRKQELLRIMGRMAAVFD